MAKLKVHGTSVLDRWFDFRRRGLFALRSDGVVLCRGLYNDWKVFSRFDRKNPNGHSLAQYLDVKRAWVTRNTGPVPILRCRCNPSHDLRAWGKAGRPLPCPCPAPKDELREAFITRAIKHLPSLETIDKWVTDSVVEATDGCSVEPDGHCQHGAASWLLVLGLI